MAAQDAADDVNNSQIVQARDVDVGQISTAMAQHAAVASRLRKENRNDDAIKRMERALAICEGSEGGHPALAVESSRQRLNFSAMLSSGGRHTEALIAIKQAQRNLESVLAWAKDCGSDDPGVNAIAREADALLCAATVAEAIELEDPENQTQLPAGMHTQMYAKAKEIADEKLPRSHPMSSLARRLGSQRSLTLDSGSPQQVLNKSASSPVINTSQMFKLPPVDERRGMGSYEAASGISQQGQKAPEKLQASDAFGRVDSEATLTGTLTSDFDKPSRAGSKMPNRRGRKFNNKNKKNIEQKNVFDDFIHSMRLDKEARLIAKGGGENQEQICKRLHQTHRLSQLALEQSTDDDLKEKRYTKTGHEVFMKNLQKENVSRSDADLAKQARRAGTVPETLEVKKLNGLLYVKPKTPEPVIVKKEPLIEEDLAGQLGGLFKKSPKNQAQLV